MNEIKPNLILAHPSFFKLDEIRLFEKEILSKPGATEHDASKFFFRFPKFLFLGEGRNIRREVFIIETDTGKKHRVDFFRQNYGSAYWDIIELKSPQKKTIKYAGSKNPRFTKGVNDAIDQAEDYRRLIYRDRTLREQLKNKGIRVYSPKILIVYGRDNQKVSPDQMQELHDRIRSGPIEFRTYDDIYRFALEHYESNNVITIPSDFIYRDDSSIPIITESDFKYVFKSMSGLSGTYAQLLIESVKVALSKNLPESSKSFHISSWRGTSKLKIQLPPPPHGILRSYNNIAHLTKLTATALSLFVLKQEFYLNVVSMFRKGLGFRFLLASDPIEYQVDNLFCLEDQFLLEISGIWSGNKTLIRQRINEKFQQLNKDNVNPLKVLLCVADIKSRHIVFKKLNDSYKRIGNWI